MITAGRPAAGQLEADGDGGTEKVVTAVIRKSSGMAPKCN
jgi:hypothetical protein